LAHARPVPLERPEAVTEAVSGYSARELATQPKEKRSGRFGRSAVQQSSWTERFSRRTSYFTRERWRAPLRRVVLTWGSAFRWARRWGEASVGPRWHLAEFALSSRSDCAAKMDA
jgi:hypothetical protein